MRQCRQGPRPGRVLLALVTVSALGACGSTEAGDEQAGGGGGPTAPESPVSDPAIPGDGSWQVGTDVQPGVYVAEGGDQCSWQRLSGAGGPATRGLPLPRPVAEIMADDAAFETEGCGSWTALEDYSGPQATEIPGNGIWIPGEDMVPGTYEAEGGEWCMWQRLKAFAPELDSVIRMGGNPRVTIESGDKGFVTTDCGSWTRVG